MQDVPNIVGGNQATRAAKPQREREREYLKLYYHFPSGADNWQNNMI